MHSMLVVPDVDLKSIVDNAGRDTDIAVSAFEGDFEINVEELVDERLLRVKNF